MMSDEHLLLKDAAGGDASALEALMSRYGSRVYRLAHGITRNSADAEEIVQDVFLQMVRKGGAFEGRDPCSSGAFTFPFPEANPTGARNTESVGTRYSSHTVT